MCASVMTAAVLFFASDVALAVNDDSLVTYLRENGLTATECLERSPRELMGWIAQRQKLGYTGTTGHEQAAISQFYEKYRATLQPAVDARFSNAKTLRAPLHKLHCLIHDFMTQVNGSRTYVTHERIAAYTEHILAKLYSAPGVLTFGAADVQPSETDVVTFARLKAALSYDTQGERPDYNSYSKDVLNLLKTAEKADPAVPALNIRFYIIDFIDRYASLLNPNSVDSRN